MGPSSQKPWRKKGADVDSDDVQEVRRVVSHISEVMIVEVKVDAVKGDSNFSSTLKKWYPWGFWVPFMVSIMRLSGAPLWFAIT